MAKTRETLELEDALKTFVGKKRIYGCEEVKIGFANRGYAGNGEEFVDFITMDSKGILKCYEIKVSMSDLKSSAKKSWYGHYNYLLVSNELFLKMNGDYDKYLPDYVGVATKSSRSVMQSIIVHRPAKKQNLTTETEAMLKESLLRTLFFKMEKYRNMCDPEKFKDMKKKLKEVEKEKEQYHERMAKAEDIIYLYDEYRQDNGEEDFSLKKFVKENMEETKCAARPATGGKIIKIKPGRETCINTFDLLESQLEEET